MKFLLGKAEEKECLISQTKRLIFFGDDAQDIVQFAVMGGKYLAATSFPYLNLKSKNIELTVDIKGHDTPQRNAYDIFEKTPVSLPNNVHRSGRTRAEMYVQGFSLPKAHQGWRGRRDLHANGRQREIRYRRGGHERKVVRVL
jgi:hypothetical protein